MDRRLGLLVGPLLCGLVAGCGGGSDEDEVRAVDALEARADAMVNEVEDLYYTDPATLPTAGAATYEGVIGLNYGAVPPETLQGYDVAGELELTVNFAGTGGEIAGIADDFVTIGNEELDGTLIIDDGSIDRGNDVSQDYTWNASIGGELTDASGMTYTLDGDLLGDFVGEDHSHVTGNVAGTGCVGAACGDVGGSFVGER